MIQLSRWKSHPGRAVAASSACCSPCPTSCRPPSARRCPASCRSNGLNLGLDLQGGSYLLLEVDVPALRAKRVDQPDRGRPRHPARGADRASGCLQREPGGVVVTITDPAQVDAAMTALRNWLARRRRRTARPTARSTRLSDNRIRFAFTDAALNAEGATAVDQSIEIVRRRIDSTRHPRNRRSPVRAPTASSSRRRARAIPSALERVIGQTAKLTFQMVDDSTSVCRTPWPAACRRIAELLPGEDGHAVLWSSSACWSPARC